MDDDCGPDFAQWYAEVGARQEQEAWLADQKAQAEYQDYLDSIAKELAHEMD